MIDHGEATLEPDIKHAAEMATRYIPRVTASALLMAHHRFRGLEVVGLGLRLRKCQQASRRSNPVYGSR